MLEEWERKKGSNNVIETILQSKRKQYALVIVICLGLLALIWPVGRINRENPVDTGSQASISGTTSLRQQLNQEVGEVLAQIDGAGQVEVSVMLSSEGIKNYAVNIREENRGSEEKESSGGSKQSTETSVQQDVAASSGSPLLVEEKYPEILGVLVVAEGAGDPRISEKLTNATATLLDVPVHRVRVMPRKGAK